MNRNKNLLILYYIWKKLSMFSNRKKFSTQKHGTFQLCSIANSKFSFYVSFFEISSIKIKIMSLVSKSSYFSRETLREKCPNTEFFLVRIQSECGKIRTWKQFAFEHFSRREICLFFSSWYWWQLEISYKFRSSRSQMFFKISVPQNFTNFTGKHLCQSFYEQS